LNVPWCKTPTTGSADCCARVARRQATAPPSRSDVAASVISQEQMVWYLCYNAGEIPYLFRRVAFHIPLPVVDFPNARLVARLAPTLEVVFRSNEILSHAARFALPTMCLYSAQARAGGLLSYGFDISENFRQMGVYTGRILKGEKPGDLPVIQTNKFEFVINLKTAKALGLTIPTNLLVRADEIIE
jgi:hypothetical protein